jgi:hypothetical protein
MIKEIDLTKIASNVFFEHLLGEGVKDGSLVEILRLSEECGPSSYNIGYVNMTRGRDEGALVLEDRKREDGSLFDSDALRLFYHDEISKIKLYD